MSSLRICIITPGHLSTNPRLVKEASALTFHGHDVKVICGRFLPWGTKHDAALAEPSWRLQHVPFGRQEAPTKTFLYQSSLRTLARGAIKLGLKSKTLCDFAHASGVASLIEAARGYPAELYIAHYIAALPAAARAAQKHNGLLAYDAEDYHLGDLSDLPQHAFEKS